MEDCVIEEVEPKPPHDIIKDSEIVWEYDEQSLATLKRKFLLTLMVKHKLPQSETAEELRKRYLKYKDLTTKKKEENETNVLSNSKGFF
jgi:hypothetical protein